MSLINLVFIVSAEFSHAAKNTPHYFKFYQHNNYHQHHCHIISVVILQKQLCSIIKQVSVCVCVLYF